MSTPSDISPDVRDAMRIVIRRLNTRQALNYEEFAQLLPAGSYSASQVENFVRGRSGKRPDSPIVIHAYQLLSTLGRMDRFYKAIDDDPKTKGCIDSIVHKTPRAPEEVDVHPIMA